MKKIVAYHWSRNDDCLGYEDGRQIVLGETLSVSGKPILCEHGLHGSVSIVDALSYASGSHLWVVEISGNVQISDDKLCGQNRKALIEYGDLLPIIVEFAFWCAERIANYAANYAAEYADESAKSDAKSAANCAKHAANHANYTADSEKLAQEEWWAEKLQQLKGE